MAGLARIFHESDRVRFLEVTWIERDNGYYVKEEAIWQSYEERY